MANVSGPDESPDTPSKPVKPTGPKRGAFPTPKSEIEKAEPYVPDGGEEDCRKEIPDQSMEIEGEDGNRELDRRPILASGPFDLSEEPVNLSQ